MKCWGSKSEFHYQPKYEFYHWDDNIAKIYAYYALHDIYKPSWYDVSGQNGPLFSRSGGGEQVGLSYILIVRFWLCTRCQGLSPCTWISRCQVLCARWHERWASGQFRNAYFKSPIVHPSQKLWPKLDLGNFAPFKTGGPQNLWKDQYLSKILFLTFVDLSKRNIQLPEI